METQDAVRAAEDVEIAAWTDLLRAPAPTRAKECGIALREFPGGVASIVAGCDVLAFNRVIGYGRTGRVTDVEIDRLLAAYKEAGVRRAFVQVNPVLADPSLLGTLKTCGLRHHNSWVKLYRDTRPLPPVETDLRTEAIGPEWATHFATVVTDAFDWPENLQPWIAGTIGRAGWRHYMAFDGMHPVATAALYVCGEWGWIDFAATAEGYRGRGAQGKLLEMRILDAAGAGCRFISVETAEQTPDKEAPSYRNMIRYGFREAFIRPNYLWTAAP